MERGEDHKNVSNNCYTFVPLACASAEHCETIANNSDRLQREARAQSSSQCSEEPSERTANTVNIDYDRHACWLDNMIAVW